jgi:hypothetical protein
VWEQKREFYFQGEERSALKTRQGEGRRRRRRRRRIRGGGGGGEGEGEEEESQDKVFQVFRLRQLHKEKKLQLLL